MTFRVVDWIASERDASWSLTSIANHGNYLVWIADFEVLFADQKMDLRYGQTWTARSEHPSVVDSHHQGNETPGKPMSSCQSLIPVIYVNNLLLINSNVWWIPWSSERQSWVTITVVSESIICLYTNQLYEGSSTHETNRFTSSWSYEITQNQHVADLCKIDAHVDSSGQIWRTALIKKTEIRKYNQKYKVKDDNK